MSDCVKIIHGVFYCFIDRALNWNKHLQSKNLSGNYSKSFTKTGVTNTEAWAWVVGTKSWVVGAKSRVVGTRSWVAGRLTKTQRV